MIKEISTSEYTKNRNLALQEIYLASEYYFLENVLSCQSSADVLSPQIPEYLI
jgi:hypothetical protein